MTPIPVTVVTGFLGAGKSTLLERWLGDFARGEVAVIVNELGEVGLDGTRFAERAERLREIAGACICCKGAAALARALTELAALVPARILVETSGAASPAGVVRALERIGPPLWLDGVITVVDGTRVTETLSFDLAVEQLAFADVVVVSRADLAPLSAADRETLEHRAPAAAILTSAGGRIGPETGPMTFSGLLEQRRDVLRILPEGRPHSAIDAVSLSYDGELDEDRFTTFVEDVLGAVGPQILRLKGIIALGGVPGVLRLQGVGDSVEAVFEPSDAPRESRLVVLGLGLDEARLRDGFQACCRSRSAR